MNMHPRGKLAIAVIGLGVALNILLPVTSPAMAEGLNKKLWDTSFVVFKSSKVHTMADEETKAFLASTKPRGVYLFLHGSGGVNKKEVLAVAKAVVPFGYVVIAPDFKKNYSGWYDTNWRDFIRRRASETKDLVAYVKTLPWVNTERLVIHGQSAGAILLADFDWGGFSAAIFTGFNCAAFGQKTIDFPTTIPALSLQDPDDPTFGAARVGKDQSYGTCEKEMTKRSSSYVLEMPGAGHKSLYQAEAVAEIQKFLTERGLTD